MKSIKCGHCGERHDSVEKVRICSWKETASSPEHGDDLRAGPDELGRNLIIKRGQSIPEPWVDAPVFEIDGQAVINPASLCHELRVLAVSRTRAVFRLDVDVPKEPSEVLTVTPYSLGPQAHLWRDELSYLIWSNSVDLTSGSPHFALLEKLKFPSMKASQRADLQLPTGEHVWLDGGPLRYFDPFDGCAVVPGSHAEVGRWNSFRSNEVERPRLAEDQLRAVTETNGTARIIAPAGSGKTRVLTERAVHLDVGWNVDSQQMMLVAFNKRAEEEIAGRLVGRTRARVRTLNALGLWIINGCSLTQRPNVQVHTINERDVRRILSDLVKVPKRRNHDPYGPWIEALSMIRLQLKSPEESERILGPDVAGLAEAWPRFCGVLETKNVVDFDHQIYRAIELLLSNPELRKTAQRACRVLLVDEFQDLTPAHLLLIRLLSGRGGSVFGVGDDDQTIYGYNGASPDWLIHFDQIFPGAQSHALGVNYRCPKPVVEAAVNLLSYNTTRLDKSISSSKERDDSCLRIRAFSGPPDRTVRATIEHVRKALDLGFKPKEIAVLSRVNALLVPTHVALSQRGIPVGGFASHDFVHRPAIQTVLSWIALGSGGAFKQSDLEVAMRRPNRSFSPATTKAILEKGSLQDLLELGDRWPDSKASSKIKEFARDLEAVHQVWSRRSLSDLITFIWEGIGVGQAVSQLDKNRHGRNAQSQQDDFVALQQLVSLCDSAGDFAGWLRSSVSIESAEDGVTLSTVHRVKGMEWPVVIIHQADASQFPHALSEDSEEERRIFHVAMTRCIDRLSIISGGKPSPFVAEMSRLNSGAGPAAGPRSPVQHGNQPNRPKPQVPPNPPSRSGRKTKIFGVTGLRLRDPGTWVISEIEGTYVVAKNGNFTRRFEFGTKVETVGGQMGILTPLPLGQDQTYVRAVDLLRELRSQLRDGRPAFTILHDRVLEAIASVQPKTRAELMAISGVGPAKLAAYGDLILEAIREATNVS